MPYLTEKARAGNRRRVKAWRERHRDTYNERMRVYRAASVQRVRDEPGQLLHAPEVPAPVG